MASQPHFNLSPEEYLELERKAEFKSEYINGYVYAMAGAKLNHVQITSNITTELSVQLRGHGCRVLASDMKVRLLDSSKFFYPDVTVFCGQPQFHDDRQDVILNPILLIEVLSDSTEARDRGIKFLSYQRIESLQEYVLISQNRVLIERYLRQEDGSWTYQAVIGLESSLYLSSVDCTLNFRNVYDMVTFENTEEITENFTQEN